MSGEPTPMVCRQCDEVITTDTENCPHCGQATRGRGQWVLMAIGAFIIVFTGIGFRKPSDLIFILVGLALLVFGLVLYREKRGRIDEGKERSAELAETETAS